MGMSFGKQSADTIWKVKQRQKRERECLETKLGKEEVTRMVRGHVCQDTHGSLGCVAEVEQTFGEQHVDVRHCKTVLHQQNCHVYASYVGLQE